MQQQLSVISNHGQSHKQAGRRAPRKRGAASAARTPEIYDLVKSEKIREELKEESLKRKAARPKAKVQAISRAPSMKSHMREALEHRQNPEKAMQPFKVMRIIDHLSAVTNSAGGTGLARNWQLDELPAFGDFTNLFDQYRFTHVTVRGFPRINTNNLTVASSVTTLTCSPIVVTFDPDDSTTPASMDELLEYPTCKVYWGFQKWSYHLKPRAAIAAYGGAFTQFADFDQWIDCASDDVEWYALKVYSAGDGASQTTHQVWDFFYEVECEFRFVR
jgi:hypothetical protein